MSSEENNDKEFKGIGFDIPKEKFNQVITKEENNEFAGLSDKEIDYVSEIIINIDDSF